MKIIVPSIIQDLPLSEYNEKLNDATLHVWLNPPRKLKDAEGDASDTYFREIAEISDRRKAVKAVGTEGADETSLIELEKLTTEQTAALARFNHALLVRWASIWSAGENPDEHWTVEELHELDQTDPALLAWMCKRSADILKNHYDQAKKG